MISLRTHNILDYVAGAAVAVLSSAVAGVQTAFNLFLILGLGQIAYSLLTNYRYAAIRVIPLGAHMALDVAAGALLLLGPWLFGYRDLLTGGQTALHIVIGLGLFALVGFTPRKTETATMTARRKVESPREMAGRP